MKKITFTIILLCFSLAMSAQYTFNPIAGPTNVAAGTPITISLNDVANSAGVTIPSTGAYSSFIITADWVAAGGNPWSSEADITIITTGGTVIIDPATTGGAGSSTATTLTFEGVFTSIYDPITDGYMDLVLNQSYGGSDADWSNVEVTLYEVPTCIEPSNMSTSNMTTTSVDLAWSTGDVETQWNLEWNGSSDFTPGNGEEEGAIIVSNTPSVTLNNLTISTNYFVYYQSDCGDGDLSLWEGPFMFSISGPGGSCANPLSMIVESDCSIATPFSFDFSIAEDLDANGENPSCDAFGNFGYWISFTAPAVGSVIFNFDGAAEDIGLEIFDACAGTAVTDCTNNTLNAGDNSGLIEGLISGNTYYAVIWRDAQSGSADVCIEAGPSCPFPTNLDANNITENSADLSWIENVMATSWTIEYGPAGFTQGTGTIINTVTTNPYTLSGLIPNTTYDIYIQSACAGENSDFSEPLTFTTTPQTSFVLDCAVDGPFTQDYCYDSGGATNPFIFTFSSSDGTPLNLTFNSGFVESGWDELVVLNSDGLPFPGYASTDENYGNAGDIGGLNFQSTGGTISYYINSDASVSCQSSTSNISQGINYTVSCATCINPEVTYSVIDDCDNGDQFLIDVDVTSLGDASSLTISNSFNADTISATETGVYQLGPFPFSVDVIATVSNDQDVNCIINSQAILVLGCPPSNDECETATVALVNDGTSCDVVTPGTIYLATDSGLPNENCDGIPNDDVWFSFTATDEVQIITIQNTETVSALLNFTLFEGSCDSLTELSCSNYTTNVVQNLTIGNTYFIRVFSYAGVSETTTFNLCIREASSNIICENATPFCSNGNEFTASNVTGIPSAFSIACLNSTPNPSWNILQIDEGGDIEVEINQLSNDGNELDVDFALFGPFLTVESACSEIIFADCEDCPNNTTNPNFYPFGNIVDCSYSVGSIENFTIINAQSDEIYLLLTTNFAGTEGSITLNQTNFGQPNSGSLKADFQIDLGPDQNLCDVDNYQLDATSQYADSYQWYFNGFAIPDEENETLTAIETGVYGVMVYNNLCSTELYEEITITFNDCEDVGLINVTAFYDDNENTVLDGNETNFANGYFTYEANNDGVINTVASSTGTFTIASFEDTDTFDINYYFYDEYMDCYDASTITFQDVSVLLGENLTVEFPIIDEQNCEDISVHLINQQSPRPGFTHTNYLVIQNLGLISASGTVNYVLDDDLSVSSISTNSNYTTTPNANGFSLDFVNLLPQQTISVYITLQTATTANLGDLVTSTATYTSSTNDVVSDNNESSVTEEVIGSYDPNDKMESHGKDILFDDFAASDEYLYYTIRFQNVGTAEAINVRIEDVLDTQLNESTFQMLRSSHDYVVTRTDDNLVWNFENINLPAEQDDAEGSDGFVYFKIKPNAGYVVGDIIENSASIYFDFNAPIITNTYQTEFVETLSVTNYDVVNFTLFPNPAKGEVTIQLANSNFETGKITIFDIQGKMILKDVKFQEESTTLDISSLENGLYFVELNIGNASTIQKLMVN